MNVTITLNYPEDVQLISQAAMALRKQLDDLAERLNSQLKAALVPPKGQTGADSSANSKQDNTNADQ